jgi:predicted dehydrogenase
MKENWGILATENGRKVIPSEQGRYHDYYEAFAEAVKTGGEPPVTVVVGARTLAVLDAARQSALEGRSITLKGYSDDVSTCGMCRNAVAGQTYSLACCTFE